MDLRNREGEQDEGEADVRAAVEKTRNVPLPECGRRWGRGGSAMLADAVKVYGVEARARIGERNEQPKTALEREGGFIKDGLFIPDN